VAAQDVWTAALLHQLRLVLNQTPADLLDLGVHLSSDLLKVHQLYGKALPLAVMRKIDLSKRSLAYLLGDTVLPDLYPRQHPLSILEVVSVLEVELFGGGVTAALHTYYTNDDLARIYLWRAPRNPTFAASL
jgi:hypothetical protein